MRTYLDRKEKVNEKRLKEGIEPLLATYPGWAPSEEQEAIRDLVRTVRELREGLEQAIELAYCASDEDDDGRPWPRMEKLEMLLKEVS